jgi:hypothetical protein
VLIPWFERAPRDDVHPDAQEFLKVLEQADVIKKRRAWLEVHEQVQVAVRTSFSPGDGAEHGDPMSPALPRDAYDLRAAAAQPPRVSTSSVTHQAYRRVPRSWLIRYLVRLRPRARKLVGPHGLLSQVTKAVLERTFEPKIVGKGSPGWVFEA